MIVAIVGPTASGKSSLGMQLAQELNGEIICADSRTIYRGLDIATAKPTVRDRGLVTHHMLDIRDVGEIMTVAGFQREAEAEIAATQQRGHTPMLIGGSGLYVDSILYRYQFPGSNRAMRQKLGHLELRELVERLETVDPEAYANIDLSNQRRVTRAIETAGQARSKSTKVRNDALVIGLTLDREEAERRIRRRVEEMIKAGLLIEVQRVGDIYGWDSPAFDIIGYRAMKPVAMGQTVLEQGISNFVAEDLKLFKKQMTWFNRDKEINWLNALSPVLSDQAMTLVRNFRGPNKVVLT